MFPGSHSQTGPKLSKSEPELLIQLKPVTDSTEEDKRVRKSISLGREAACSENFHVSIRGVGLKTTCGVMASWNTPSELLA